MERWTGSQAHERSSRTEGRSDPRPSPRRPIYASRGNESYKGRLPETCRRWSEDRRPAARLVTGAREAISASYARLRRAMDPARQALRPVCEELAVRIGRECPRWKRGPRPKIAAVERREASAPDRKGAQKAPRKRLPRASLKRVHARLDALCTQWVPRKHPRLSALRSPSSRGAMRATPRAQLRRGNANARPLFEIVDGDHDPTRSGCSWAEPLPGR